MACARGVGEIYITVFIQTDQRTLSRKAVFGGSPLRGTKAEHAVKVDVDTGNGQTVQRHFADSGNHAALIVQIVDDNVFKCAGVSGVYYTFSDFFSRQILAVIGGKAVLNIIACCHNTGVVVAGLREPFVADVDIY